MGGDVCAATNRYPSTLPYLDDLFDLDEPGNFWALGNHDVGSTDEDHFLIQAFTGRNEFHTEHVNGLTVMVLNSNLYDPECERLQAQYDMFEQVCDTIQESSHLILLSHHVTFSEVWGVGNLWSVVNANKPFWQSRCQPNSKFHQILYPKLVEVQQRGVQVMYITGDWGQKMKEYQHQTHHGIWFIGSGIDRTNRYMPDSLQTAKDKILFLQHDKEERSLDWQFLDLDSLSSL